MLPWKSSPGFGGLFVQSLEYYELLEAFKEDSMIRTAFSDVDTLSARQKARAHEAPQLKLARLRTLFTHTALDHVLVTLRLT